MVEESYVQLNVTLEARTYMVNKVVRTLCQTMRKPDGGENGCVVLTRAEMTLHDVCFMARRTSRTTTDVSIALAEVESFSKRRTNKEGFKVPTEKMKLAKPDNIMEFIDE
jgi:hypothetical protein